MASSKNEWKQSNPSPKRPSTNEDSLHAAIFKREPEEGSNVQRSTTERTSRKRVRSFANKAIVACVRCRTRKIKCSGPPGPCVSCTKVGAEHECDFVRAGGQQLLGSLDAAAFGTVSSTMTYGLDGTGPQGWWDTGRTPRHVASHVVMDDSHTTSLSLAMPLIASSSSSSYSQIYGLPQQCACEPSAPWSPSDRFFPQPASFAERFTAPVTVDDRFVAPPVSLGEPREHYYEVVPVAGSSGWSSDYGHSRHSSVDSLPGYTYGLPTRHYESLMLSPELRAGRGSSGW